MCYSTSGSNAAYTAWTHVLSDFSPNIMTLWLFAVSFCSSITAGLLKWEFDLPQSVASKLRNYLMSEQDKFTFSFFKLFKSISELVWFTGYRLLVVCTCHFRFASVLASSFCCSDWWLSSIFLHCLKWNYMFVGWLWVKKKKSKSKWCQLDINIFSFSWGAKPGI